MQDCDLLLAGDPASSEPAREHARDAQADRSSDPLSWSDTASWRGRGGRALRRKGSTAEDVLRAFNTWAFKREQPSDAQLMLGVVSHAMKRAAPLPFVLYWGKGPRCGLAEPDVQCLDFLALLVARVTGAYPAGAALTLIFTDTHARLNGHTLTSMQQYFSDVHTEARKRGFESCWLSDLTAADGLEKEKNLKNEPLHHELASRLIASARKWYHGPGGPERGAFNYYLMNLVERRAVELAFPNSIFLTFNGSELRGLFPEQLPIFYMYSLRRGIGVKPWFLPADTVPCSGSPCTCGAMGGERAI